MPYTINKCVLLYSTTNAKYKLLCNVDNLGSIKKLPRLSHRRENYIRFNIKRWNGPFHLLYDKRSQIIYLNLCFVVCRCSIVGFLVPGDVLFRRCVDDEFLVCWPSFMKQFVRHYAFIFSLVGFSFVMPTKNVYNSLQVI